MKKIYYLIIFGVMCNAVQAQVNPFLFDDFSDSTKAFDISTLIIRNGETEEQSAFDFTIKSDDNGLAFPSIVINNIAEEAGICCTYDNGSYLAHNCIDYAFPDVINRRDDTIMIEFDAIWEMESDGKGEASKLIIYLMYEYPEEGPGFGVYNDLSEDFYGKPAYQLWILNGSNHAFMSYGGGLEKQGSFISLPANDPQYWLPGFTEKKVQEGEIDTQDPYPLSAYARLTEGSTVSETRWKHYTWLIAPERLSVFWRNTGAPSSEDELMFFMEIPSDEEDIQQINDAHGSFATSMPLLYEWFEEINAVRFFINKDSYFTNIRISKSGDPLNTFVEFKRNKDIITDSETIYNMNIEIFNASSRDSTFYNVELIGGDSSLINGFTSDSGFFVPGNTDIKEIPLDIVPGSDNLNDTLTFRISNVRGGNLASTGEINQFQLIINTTGTNSGIHALKNAAVLPNPVNEFIHVHGIQSGTVFSLYDISGKKMKSGTFESGKGIEIGHFEPGIYFLKLNRNSAKRVFKIVKN